jgi:hypothetical protein
VTLFRILDVETTGVDPVSDRVVRIEIAFPIAVEMTEDDMRMLDNFANEICERYERANPGRVMWPAGHGSKMLSDDEPIPFDHSVYAVDCAEREDYEWKCAKCGERQDEHANMTIDPKAGVCEFEPAPPQRAAESATSIRPRGHVPMHVYLAAVHGRRALRQALKDARNEMAALKGATA